MTLQEATQKVTELAERNQAKLQSKLKFQFPEGVIFLDDTASPTTVNNDDLQTPCTIIMDLNNFEKLLEGELNPMMAFMMGKMKIDGDKAVAMKLASIL
ncbi:SCP2 sterol-binding domain-containing protein [Marinoscillum sp. MHG1-6]|uniref:SCP2 sterol-binding domain-containing protein n=1 Tax=Marinoscillum sp. MHG1-6 TaxID=2959627 RepID=UPI00215804F0|nr:SCP2 sterol-binding domain-containing protein [Marinoscillum sp. MHG1-6]